MKKILFKVISILITVFTVATVFTACDASLNERQKGAIKAFDGILAVLPAENKDGWYQLTSPDGGAKFVYSNDSAWLAIDAEPFIIAGLDIAKLEADVPESTFVSESVFYKRCLSFSLPAWDMLNQNVKDTALEQFKADIRHFKCVETEGTYKINFADYYNTRLDAAVFEWSKSIDETDSDIVFTLAAEWLTTAGVDPEKLEGWDYIKNSDGVWVFQKAVPLNSTK